jgi:mono/diheme cytochrome c family protein
VKKVLLICFGLIALSVMAVGFLTLGGHIYLGADLQPGKMESAIAMKILDKWIDRVKPETKNPIPPTPENLVAGIKLYRSNCAGCHGDKLHPKSQFGLAMYPPAPMFFEDTPDMEENENFVVIKHGIRWTGMPAWKSMMTDQDIWILTTFLSHLNELPPEALELWNTVKSFK